MTKEEAAPYRKKLSDMFDRLNGDRAQLSNETLRKIGGEASGNLSNTPVHLADLGTDTFEEEMSLGLMETQSQLLGEIRDALGRIDQGTYGKCEECGKDIGRERLQALPYTRYCIACARKFQEGTA